MAQSLKRRTTRVRYLAVQDYSLLYSVQTGSGPNQPPIQWVLGAVSLCVKGHSPPSSAEDKDGGAIPSLPHIS
jgi:hypothetical protein